MEQLFKKIEIINYKYSLQKDENKFNLFEILRKPHDEVHLHSKFISELLNPKGKHGFKSTFLELFIEEIIPEKLEHDESDPDKFDHDELISNQSDIGELPQLISDETSVYCEKSIGELSKDKTIGGRIDILIENESCPPMIIENKIYAADQKNQLLRYHNYNQKGKLYYLTLSGDEPSDYALGELGLETIKLISYKHEINNWISKCIEKSSKKPNLREALIQYQQLINKLTGNSTNMAERKEIVTQLSKKENVLNAKIIAENWVHVKWHCEMDFWNDFKTKIETNSELKVLERQKYSDEKLNSVIHKSRNRNPWYGITLKITEYKGSDVYFMIERGFGNLYYGIKLRNEQLIPEVEELLLEKSGVNHLNKFWAGGKDLVPEINFESFSNEATLLLCDEEIRKTAIDNYWVEISAFIVDVKNVLNDKVKIDLSPQ